jgi:hypothetical protein
MPRTKLLFLLLFLWLASPDLMAQRHAMRSIRGKAVDRETGLALPYASVGIQGKPIGTVANAAGEFDFYLPASYARDTFFVSFLGYETYRAVVESTHSDTVFRMGVKSTQLAEVVVREQRLSAREIVQRALERIAQNYPTEPYLMEGFFRMWGKHEMPESFVRQHGAKRHGSLLEAAVTVYDEGYITKRRGKRLEEDVFLQEIRKNQLPPGQLEYREKHNWLNTLLAGNYVRYNQARGNIDFLKGPLDFPNDLDYQFREAVEENGETMYFIDVSSISIGGIFTTKSTAAYRLYISQQDYAILRIDLTGHSSKDGFVHQLSTDSRWRCISVDNTLRFRRYNGKLYLNYLRMEWKNRQIEENTGAILEGHDSHVELLINRIITTEVAQQRKNLGKPMKENQPLDEQLKAYHPEFWQHYNLVKDNPLDQDLIQLLEKGEKLEEQFNRQKAKK